ncbi:hypothetical protein PI124_g6887 [Phytophthora idaei]|nr:hypothetical protein PI125_g9586 [Phytophthora idaei]KAG3161772.1 hypothetical protein PI126_g6277 [Phytophthora idaei]KAG3248439.1 hypothetical protein PI124_g6887 [Phytophthora idaei]
MGNMLESSDVPVTLNGKFVVASRFLKSLANFHSLWWMEENDDTDALLWLSGYANLDKDLGEARSEVYAVGEGGLESGDA